MKKAFITGIAGQDGSYLAELLLAKGYEVHGLTHRLSSWNAVHIHHVNLHYGDLADTQSVHDLIRTIRPDEVYHLGAQSHVGTSFDLAEYTGNITGLGTLRLLEAIRKTGLSHTKFYQASSSEMFGKTTEIPQKETTAFHPRSPYGVAKAFAYWIAKNYREAYRMFVCNGILFNHESPRRSDIFVTRKITSGIAEILAGRKDKIYLGNLNAKRDWGYAPEYVEAMWCMMQHHKPDDFVIATGQTHTVQEFVEEAFTYAGLDWEKYVVIDHRYFRPADIDILVGDATKAKRILGWEPRVQFKDLVHIMVDADRRIV